jgi:hypothetical protein
MSAGELPLPRWVLEQACAVTEKDRRHMQQQVVGQAGAEHLLDDAGTV